MPVAIARAAGTLTVTITVNVADILTATGISAAEKKVLAAQRAAEELSRAIATVGLSDVDIDTLTDAAKASLDADAAARKAARLSGTL